MIGYIYKISSEQTDKIYIGSTVSGLRERFIKHKCDFKRNGYCSSKLIMCYDDCSIECIEELEVDHKHDIKLRMREDYYYDLNKEIVVNKQKPLRTKKQWTADNIEYVREQKKQYYYDNREYFLEKKRQYYYDNRECHLEKIKQKYTCECGSIISSGNKVRHSKSQKHINFMNLKN